MKHFRARIILKSGFERIVILEAENEKAALTKVFAGTLNTTNGAELPMGGSFWWIVGEIAAVEFLSGTA